MNITQSLRVVHALTQGFHVAQSYISRIVLFKFAGSSPAEILFTRVEDNSLSSFFVPSFFKRG